MMISTWLILLDCDSLGLTEECILVLGDNTSTIGWSFWSGKVPTTSFYYHAVQCVAQKLAKLLTDSTHILASEHLKGKKNVIADCSLTRGTARRNQIHSHRTTPQTKDLLCASTLFFSQLIPEGFEILPLPDEILSFTTRALQIAELSWIHAKSPCMKVKTGSGDDGLDTVTRLDLTLTPSSLLYPNENEKSSFDPSSPCIAKLSVLLQEDFLASVRSPWWHQLCALLQATWLQRSGVVSNGAPFKSRMAPNFTPPFEPS
jgi:hypothetical protein